MAAKYFVGTGNWSDTNRWATSSGGPGGTGVPALNDDVYFDSNSGNATVDVLVGSTSSGLLSINFNGYTSTITMSNNIHIVAGGTVSIVGSTNVTTSGTSPLYLNSTVTLNSGGGSWGGNVTFGGGAKTLTSDFRILGSTSTVSGGTPSISGASFKYYSNGLTVVPGLTGNSTFVLTGSTWSGAGQVLTNLHFDGNVIVSGSVIWNPTVANGAATLKYISGTITTTGSTLTTTLTPTSGTTTYDTSGITWNNITFNNTSGIADARLTMTSNLVATGTINFTNTTATPTFILEGTATINSPLATFNVGVTGVTFTFTNEVVAGPLTRATASTSFVITSGSILRLNGNFPTGSGAVTGTGTIRLGGGGTWSWTVSPGAVRCSVEFVGDYTVAGNASGVTNWQPTVANGAATLKWTAGTITTTGTTLNVTLVTNTNIINFDTGPIVWNNISFPNVVGIPAPNFVSDLRCSGNLTTNQGSGASNAFTPTGTGAIRTLGTGNFVATAGCIINLNTDWYFNSYSFNSYTMNNNKVFIDTLFTPSTTSSSLVGTTEFVMRGGSLTGLGGSSAFNVNITILPSLGNTVTASGAIRFSISGTRTLKFDGSGGGSFNPGTSNLVIGGVCTLDMQDQPLYDVTITTFNHTLSSLFKVIGTLQVNGAATFTNPSNLNLTQATLSIGTPVSGSGFTFVVPTTLTVLNLDINSLNSLLINSNAINVTGNLRNTVTATAAGSTQINLTGTGTWSTTGTTTAWLKNPVTINTSGTITLGANIALYNTTTYTAGTIDSISNSSTLRTFDTTLVGFGSTPASYLNNLTFYSGGTGLKINSSAAYFLGTFTTNGNNNLNVSSSATFGFSTNILSLTVAPTTHTFKALTEYTVRGQLILTGTVGTTNLILTSSVATPSNRFKLTLDPSASQTVRYVNAQYIDSSGGQTIRNRYGALTSTINWMITNLMKAKTWVDIQE